MRFLVKILTVAAVLGLAGCSRSVPSLTLATTTSTQDSGLLDMLVPRFREQTGIEVKVVAVGTGQALQLGRRGDADVLMVHAPAAEKKFMDEGFGSWWREVMYNDFVVVGPPADPAGIRGQKSVSSAFTQIARRGSTFISRGDESGTHQKEKEIWRRAGIEPKGEWLGEWYLQSGAGMGQVLRMADEKRAYTLTDRGTFLALRKGLDLVILCEGDPLLVNQYSVILVNPKKHPHVNKEATQKFADFLLAPETQKAIAEFGKDRFGQSLFFPGSASSVPTH
jgi:tungstate transport system substrate-binding protein